MYLPTKNGHAPVGISLKVETTMKGVCECHVPMLQSGAKGCQVPMRYLPPPIESRKSSQSVNPHYVWT